MIYGVIVGSTVKKMYYQSHGQNKTVVMYYVKSKKESQAHKKEDNEGPKDLQDQDNDKLKEVNNKTKTLEEDSLQGCQSWRLTNKSLRDAHDKYNLEKYPHFAHCTKTIEVKPKIECEVLKRVIWHWWLSQKVGRERSKPKRGIIEKITDPDRSQVQLRPFWKLLRVVIPDPDQSHFRDWSRKKCDQSLPWIS